MGDEIMCICDEKKEWVHFTSRKTKEHAGDILR